MEGLLSRATEFTYLRNRLSGGKKLRTFHGFSSKSGVMNEESKAK